MKPLRFAVALAILAGVLLVVSTGFAEPATPAPAEVAKAPAAADAGQPAVPPAKTATAPPKAAPPPATVKALKVAQLPYPVPPTASAAELLQAAEDYAFYQDWASYRQYLRQVVTSHGGTKDAGQALVLLLGDAINSGDQAGADALNAEVGAYTDPEVVAFAAMMRAAAPAEKAEQLDAVEQAYQAYADQWPGTSTGWWARLQLGNRYRFQRGDYARAITVFQELLAAQPSEAVADEARFALAQCLQWSERLEEAKQAFEAVIETTRSPGIQMRALAGYSEVLGLTFDDDVALQAVSHIITSYPTHPCAGFAYAQRSIVDERLGNWEAAVADVRAYFTYPPAGTYNQARGHLVLAKDAYRKGNLDEAAAEFAVAARLAAADGRKTHTADFGGKANAGLAAVAQGRGDLRGAMQLLQTAADAATTAQAKAAYLYQAADLAQQLNDATARDAIIGRMVAELPGSHLTTKLVGHELVPAPEI